MRGASKRLYFGLGTLLLLVAAFAVLLSAARIGYHRGYAAGQSRRAKESFVVRAYSIADLSDPSANYDEPAAMVELLHTTIDPSSWDTHGGTARIARFDGSLELVITQTATAHSQIESLLETLRNRKADNRAPGP